MVFSNAPEFGAASLSVSIVTFRPKLSLLSMTLESLVRAVRYAVAQQGQLAVSLWIVDNTPVEEAASFAIGKTVLGAVERCNEISVEFIQGHGNVGYGRGHNLALSESSAEYHLVLNPDVELAEDSLREALRYMAENRAVGIRFFSVSAIPPSWISSCADSLRSGFPMHSERACIVTSCEISFGAAPRRKCRSRADVSCFAEKRS
jgi:GT2 family glycosyltransferase